MSYELWLYYNPETGAIDIERHTYGHGEMVEALPIPFVGKALRRVFGPIARTTMTRLGLQGVRVLPLASL